MDPRTGVRMDSAGLGWIPERLSHPRAFITSPSLYHIPEPSSHPCRTGIGMDPRPGIRMDPAGLGWIPEPLSYPRVFITSPSLHRIPNPLSHPRPFISPPSLYLTPPHSPGSPGISFQFPGSGKPCRVSGLEFLVGSIHSSGIKIPKIPREFPVSPPVHAREESPGWRPGERCRVEREMSESGQELGPGRIQARLWSSRV